MARSCEFLEMYLNLNTEALLLQTESFDKLYYFSSSITNGDRKKARKHRHQRHTGKIPGQDAWFPARGW